MTAVLSFIVATCIVLGGGLVFLAGVVTLAVMAGVSLFARTTPDVTTLDRWLSRAFLVGSVLSSVAAVGVLVLAVLA